MKTKEINGSEKIQEIITKHPGVIKIMYEHGLHCVGCMVASMESLEDGAKAHGMTKDQINDLISEINKEIAKKN